MEKEKDTKKVHFPHGRKKFHEFTTQIITFYQKNPGSTRDSTDLLYNDSHTHHW